MVPATSIFVTAASMTLWLATGPAPGQPAPSAGSAAAGTASKPAAVAPGQPAADTGRGRPPGRVVLVELYTSQG